MFLLNWLKVRKMPGHILWYRQVSFLVLVFGDHTAATNIGAELPLQRHRQINLNKVETLLHDLIQIQVLDEIGNVVFVHDSRLGLSY